MTDPGAGAGERRAAGAGAPGAALAIALAAALPYARTFDVPWYFDDYAAIVQDPSVHAAELSPAALAPAVDAFPLHRWLARLTFAVSHALGGLAPAGWHAFNLAAHVLASLLALALALEVLARADPGLDPARRRRAALLAALLFAVHPLQTMAVTYVVQRMAVLAALFALAALLAWARARRTEGTARLAWLGAAALAAFLALSSKENAAVLPLLVVAYEAAVAGDLRARLRRWALPATIAAAALAGALAAGVEAYRDELATEKVVSALPLADRLLTQPRVIALYLGRVLLPWPGWLHVDDGLAASRGLLEPPATAAALLLLAALVAAVVLLRRRLPVVSFGLAFFLLALAVEQSVIPLDFVFEHRLYLPLFGLALAAGWGLERLGGRPGRRPETGSWPVALPLLLLLAAGTVARNETWRDPVRLHGQDAAAFPWLTRPLLNLGAALYERGELDGAEAALRRLLALDPADARGWSNLAQVAVARGDADGAIRLARQGLALDPACTTCAWNLAAAALQAGRAGAAVEAFEAVVRLAPQDAGAWAGLSDALRQAGRPAEALAAAQRAVALAPGSPGARAALRRVLPR